MKRVSTIYALLLTATIAVLAVGRGRDAVAANEAGFVVIVNPDNSTSEVDRAFLRDAFLRKISRWGNGETIKPIDLSRRFAAREQFAREVLKKSLPQLKRYWSQQIFSGKGVPPPESDSEKALISYVLANRGAIGYLPAGSDPGGAKVVKVK